MLSNRFAVITGSASGIGKATAKVFVRENVAGIAIVDYNYEAACKTAESLGGKAIAVKCDISKADQVEAAAKQILEHFGRVDILVNNAGITRDGMFHKMSESQWDLVIEVNLKSMYNCCQAVVAGMRNRKYGKIVNLASVSAFGNFGQTNYGASKGGVIGFTKCLAREVARNRVTVNCIAPSYINTEMLQAVPEATMQRFLAAIPMERLGEPEELAAAAAFLCSDDSSFVTGECLVVSGGSYM